MRTLALALAAAGVLALGGVRLVSAGDPVPLTQDEQTRIRHLIDDLGSDDFRVREAATKALMEFGEKAREALVAAQKSDSAEVRFRAEQLLRRLDGANHEKKLDGPDAPGGSGGSGRNTPPPGTWPPPFGDDTGRWGEEIQRRVREMEEQMGRLLGGDRPRLLGGNRALHLKADGAELNERHGKATLTLTQKEADGSTSTRSYDGTSLDDILAIHPDLKDKPGVASLVEQAKKAKEGQHMPTFNFGGLGQGPGTSFSFQSNGVQVEQTPGHVKVTITETGPDGKAETKTYEGTDLEALKAEHPELKEKLGGVNLKIHVGPGLGQGGVNPFGKDGSPWGDDWKNLPTPGEVPPIDDQDGDVMSGLLGQQTGPFGLQTVTLDDALRAQLGIEAGGALVRVVREDSQASKIGVRLHDVITAVNGAKVGSPGELKNLLRDVKPDAPLTIDVVRGGKAQTLKR